MPRVMGNVSDEQFLKLRNLLPYGSQEAVIGMMIEDWIAYCEKHPGASLRYIERELPV